MAKLSQNHAKRPLSYKLANVVVKKKRRPPSTFGRDEEEEATKNESSQIKKIAKLNLMDQRIVTRDYMAKKIKEIKVKYQSQGEITARFNELLKMVKITEVTINIDSLTGQKIDPKVCGIIFAELSILTKVEIMSDKTNADIVDKIFNHNNKKDKDKKDQASGSTVSKKVSQNTFDTLVIIDGLGKNMRKPPVPMSETDCGSNLRLIHIMNIRINSIGWQSFAKGIESPHCVLDKLVINLVEFDRDSLSTLTDGVRKNLSISTLDLSYNNLKDAYGDIIAKVISAQTQSRDHVKWKKGLRIIDINTKKKEPEKQVPGLKELVLTNNKFGPTFLKTVMNAIRDDNYMRVLDVRKNKFTASMLSETRNYDIMKSLQANESLTNIDFRENDGYDKIFRFKLSCLMMRNIEQLRG